MRAKLHVRWQKFRQHRVAIIITTSVIVIIIALIFISYRFDWTGFNVYSITWLPMARSGASLPITSVEEQLPSKTLWDWLQLLIAPAVISLAVTWFTHTQQQRDRRLEQLQHDRDQQLAEQQAMSEREATEKRAQTERVVAKQRYEQDQKIALDKQHEDLLQAYLDRMSELLLEKNLRTSPSEEVKNVARVRTITVLRQLDAQRIGSVFTFLREAGLMSTTPNSSIVSLKDANLSRVNWEFADLRGAILTGANLSGANLKRVDFSGAELSGANLSGADLSDAILNEANLTGASLLEANLHRAYLDYADLTGANVWKANMTQVDLSAIIITKEQLSRAKLSVTH